MVVGFRVGMVVVLVPLTLGITESTFGESEERIVEKVKMQDFKVNAPAQVSGQSSGDKIRKDIGFTVIKP